MNQTPATPNTDFTDTIEFVDVSDEIAAEYDSNPDVQRTVAQMWEEIRQHRTGMAAVRAVMGVTQTELAERVGVSQAAIAQSEAKTDLMVSTLTRNLHALGATAVVRLYDGTEIRLEELFDATGTENRQTRTVGTGKAKTKKATVKGKGRRRVDA